jgi:hypothetical protein
MFRLGRILGGAKVYIYIFVSRSYFYLNYTGTWFVYSRPMR